MRILVVEDSRASRLTIVKSLEEMGHSPVDLLEAADGVEALASLEENEGVDLVLTDWIMPNMTGIELLRRMKGDARFAQIPVIFLTGVTQRDRVLEAVKEGARAVIVKPVRPEMLREKIRAVQEEKDGSGVRMSPAAALRRALAQATKQHDSSVPFLAQMPPPTQEALRLKARKVKFPAGQRMVEFHQAVGALLVIESGEVEVLSNEGGKCLEVLHPGECVGVSSFLSGDSAAMVAKARLTTVLLSVDAASFDALLVDHPVLGVYLTRCLARQAERDNARLWSKLADGLSGHLGMMAMGELAQTLHSGLKTGLLRFSQPGEPGEIYFEEGEVRHARVGNSSGEEAFFELLARTEGSFTFLTGARDVPREELRPTMVLLVDGLRRIDEKKRRLAAPPQAAAGGA